MITLALKNLTRRPRHTLTMIIGIALAVSLIFGIFTAINGITYAVLQRQLDDVAVDYIGYSDYENYTEAKQALLGVDGVEHVLVDLSLYFRGCANLSPLPQDRSKFANYTVILHGTENESFSVLSGVHLIDGSLNLTKGIVIEQSFASIYGIKPGDRIYFGMLYYDHVNNTESYFDFNVSVAGIIDISDNFEKVFAPSDMYIHEEQYLILWNIPDTVSLLNAFNKERYSMEEEYKPYFRYLIFIDRENIIDPWNMDITKQRINRLTNRLNLVAAPYNMYISSQLEWALWSVEIWAQTARVTFGVFSAPTLILGAFLTVTTAYIVLEQRRKEYALLKVRGAVDSALKKMMLFEGLIIGLIAGILGIFGGTLLSNYFFIQLMDIWGVSLTTISLIPNFLSFDAVFALSLSLIFALFATYLPSKDLAKITPSEAVAEYIPEVEHEEWKPKWTLIGLIASSIKIIEWIVGFDPSSLMYSMVFATNFLIIIILVIYIFIDTLILQYITPIIFPYCLAKIVTMKIQKTSRFFEIILKPIFGDTISFSLRNMVRKAPRYARVSFIIALTLAFGMATLINNATNLDYSIRQVQGRLGTDIHVSLSSTNWTIYQNFTQIDGVENASILARYSVDINFGYSIFYLTDPLSYYWVTRQFYDNDFIEGIDIKTAMETLEQENNSILIQKKFADDFGVSIGDSFNITFTNPSGKDIEVPFKVIGIINFVPGCNDYMWDFYEFGFGFASNYVFMANLWYLNNSNVGISSSSFMSLVDIKDNVNATQIKETLIDEYGNAIYSISTYQEAIDEIFTNPYTASINSFLGVQYTFTIIIATIGIGLVMMMSVIERKREIGILISKGIAPSQLIKYLLGEGIVMLVISFSIGIFAGYAIGVGYTSGQPFIALISSPIKMHLIIPTETYTFLGVSLISFLVAMLIPGFIATRVKPYDVLKMG